VCAQVALVAAPLVASAQTAAPDVPDAALREQVSATLRQAAAAHPGIPNGARVVVELGRLDARLRLAPCERVEPQWPASAWGAVRVGLRCAAGPTRWHVHLPATVQVLAPGWVAAADLAAGTELAPSHLRRAEVDLAAGGVVEQPLLLGRALARPLVAGAPVRGADLRARQWFAAGDVVQVVAVGRGYRVSGQGQAMAPGVEGQRVRVRTDSGRIVTGVPVAPSRVEVPL
jgi:flagella basal body P-ring formation protein FlgA